MTLNTSISLISAVIAWALAIFLGMQLLSGTFDTRTCATDCVNMVFWISLAIALIGFIFSVGSIKIGTTSLIKKLSILALFILCGIYATLVLVGHFGILS